MLTIVLQAGGKSSRMGENKALRSFLGSPLIQRLLDRFDGVGQETLIITNRLSGFETLGVKLFQDVIPDRGALGGLYTALTVATQPYTGVIATDLPFASPDLVDYMLNVIQKEDYDAVIPRSEYGLEPLHAVYNREKCLPIVRKALEDDRWRMTSWHDQAAIHLIPPAISLNISGSLHTFMNVNTPEDFLRAEKLAKKHPGL